MNSIKLNSSSGTVSLLLGPMSAGKTTELLRIMNLYKLANINVLAIKYHADTRFSSDNVVVSRDGYKSDKTYTVIADKLMMLTIEESVRAIFIDEGQFYDDIAEFARYHANCGRNVFISALDGTSDQKMFEPIIKLIPWCDNITKINAICTESGELAPFTVRLRSGPLIEIGGDDIYKAVSRSILEKKYTNKSTYP
jgi:thymidine kinase